MLSYKEFYKLLGDIVERKVDMATVVHDIDDVLLGQLTMNCVHEGYVPELDQDRAQAIYNTATVNSILTAESQSAHALMFSKAVHAVQMKTLSAIYDRLRVIESSISKYVKNDNNDVEAAAVSPHPYAPDTTNVEEPVWPPTIAEDGDFDGKEVPSSEGGFVDFDAVEEVDDGLLETPPSENTTEINLNLNAGEDVYANKPLLDMEAPSIAEQPARILFKPEEDTPVESEDDGKQMSTLVERAMAAASSHGLMVSVPEAIGFYAIIGGIAQTPISELLDLQCAGGVVFNYTYEYTSSTNKWSMRMQATHNHESVVPSGITYNKWFIDGKEKPKLTVGEMCKFVSTFNECMGQNKNVVDYIVSNGGSNALIIGDTPKRTEANLFELNIDLN
jgi:hypothetical protein